MERISDHLVAAERNPRMRDRLRALLTLRDVEHEAAAVYRSIRVSRNPNGVGGMSIYGEIADAMTDELLDLCQAWRPDLIVFDPLTYAGPIVGALLGIPAIRNLFGPDVAYFAGAGELAGLMPVLKKHGLSTVNAVGAATVDPCPPSLQFPDEMTPTRRIRHRYVPYNGLSEVPRWLHDAPERPRVCLTWGTSMVRLCGDEAFLPEELLRGAIKLAEERDVELVLAITSSQRDLLPPDLPEGVRVSEGVPLQALLPTCQALMHQGGAGTTLTALVSGLPQLVFTAIPDQSANAHILVAAGAGKAMPIEGLDASGVLAAGHELLDDPAYAAAGQRIREEIMELPTPAQIVPEIEALAG